VLGARIVVKNPAGADTDDDADTLVALTSAALTFCNDEVPPTVNAPDTATLAAATVVVVNVEEFKFVNLPEV